MRLRNPDYTRVLLVTRAETTPVLEASALADDLARAGIEPWGWVVPDEPRGVHGLRAMIDGSKKTARSAA